MILKIKGEEETGDINEFYLERKDGNVHLRFVNKDGVDVDLLAIVSFGKVCLFSSQLIKDSGFTTNDEGHIVTY